MNKYDIESAIITNRPGEPFVLIERVDRDDIENLDSLDWQAGTEPPTWDEVVEWTNALVLERDKEDKCREIKTALAASDLWAIRHVEDGASLTSERIAYRENLRTLLRNCEQGDTDPKIVGLPDLPAVPNISVSPAPLV